MNAKKTSINLYNQQEATKAELGKPFPQEAELAQKSARLAELDVALNMEETLPCTRGSGVFGKAVCSGRLEIQIGACYSVSCICGA